MHHDNTMKLFPFDKLILDPIILIILFLILTTVNFSKVDIDLETEFKSGKCGSERDAHNRTMSF